MSGAKSPGWGWHQLRSHWARRLVDEADVAPGDLVLDIGAGKGALTAPLVAAGARVVAVELHPRRAAVLRERFAEDPVTVVQRDAADLLLPRRPFRVVANPPFGVTTAILRGLLGRHSALVRADLIVPVHVAARWARGRGADAEHWAGRFEPSIARRLPRRALVPEPPGPVAVLRLGQRRR